MGMPQFPDPVRTGKSRDGIMYAENSINKWIVAGGMDWILLKTTEENHMSQVDEAYEKANEVISKAKLAYDKTLSDFRGSIKNDLSSIASSADRVQKETVKMANAYKESVTLLTSPDMIQAIENAERLATAIKAISELQTHKITVALLSGKPE